MRTLKSHSFLIAAQALAALLLLWMLIGSNAWQRADGLGRTVFLMPALLAVVVLASTGHYYLRKQIAISAWGYSVVLLLLMTTVLAYVRFTMNF